MVGQPDNPGWDEWWGPAWINVVTVDKDGKRKDFINIAVTVDRYALPLAPLLSFVLTVSIATTRTKMDFASGLPLG
jgi:hypothetical protein